ncbi:MAG: hypothetical protein E6R03_15795 [Hyphomicrobiaceae bacterium]|nr:MAG: hypothetical protein E6R03_15795 [Hyphomicrobiaceae bacterium]
MPVQTTYSQFNPVAVPGMLFDFEADASGIVSFEAATDLPAGRFVSLDANGRAVLANGSLPIIGVTVYQSTQYLAPSGAKANKIVPILRKGRIFAEKAVVATAPAMGAIVQRHASDGTVVSTAGVNVVGAAGYQRGTTAQLAIPTNCALVELNLPVVTA